PAASECGLSFAPRERLFRWWLVGRRGAEQLREGGGRRLLEPATGILRKDLRDDVTIFQKEPLAQRGQGRPQSVGGFPRVVESAEVHDPLEEGFFDRHGQKCSNLRAASLVG